MMGWINYESYSIAHTAFLLTNFFLQVRDEFRPWIGKECKSFCDILRRAGAKVNYSLHFEEEAPSLLSHFKVLNHFI